MEVREPNFSLDLPSEWEVEASAEQGVFVYRQVEGSATLTVTLLGVRPMYAIADQHRLLQDFIDHRSKFEAGPDDRIAWFEPVTQQQGDAYVGAWLGEERESGSLVRHHSMLVGGLLADFRYDEPGVSTQEFDEHADAIFRTITVSTG
jgi:hypothetical protein